jgi:hypothetical protein
MGRMVQSTSFSSSMLALFLMVAVGASCAFCPSSRRRQEEQGEQIYSEVREAIEMNVD